jgi:hypothetical protein
MKNKIPDNVVYNEDIQKYDSSIKPYPTDLSAPVITMNDTVAWKNRSIHKVNQKLKATVFGTQKSIRHYGSRI